MAIGAAIGGIGSALIGSNAAGDAADAQAAAAGQQLELQREIYENQQEMFSPWYDSGVVANDAYNYLLGLGPQPMIGGTAPAITAEVVGGGTGGGTAYPEPTLTDLINSMGDGLPEWSADVNNAAPNGVIDRHAGQSAPIAAPAASAGTIYRVGDQTFATLEEAQEWANSNLEGGTPYRGFQASPGYQFMLEQGIGAIDAGAAAAGTLNSGATLLDYSDYTTGLANQEFNNYLAQVAGVSGAGQAAAGQTAQAGSNYATGASNALANMGNAQAAGSIGSANALMGGINTGLGLYQYHNNLNGGNSLAGAGIGGLY